MVWFLLKIDDLFTFFLLDIFALKFESSGNRFYLKKNRIFGFPEPHQIKTFLREISLILRFILAVFTQNGPQK
jgi:hypothetical protein